jgi:hypothetical protein
MTLMGMVITFLTRFGGMVVSFLCLERREKEGVTVCVGKKNSKKAR